MPIRVYDYRVDLANLTVRPEIRNRFRQVELGPRPEFHSHDLGGETFLVVEGSIEFSVEDEQVVCQTGQTIYVPPKHKHAVRAVGDRPGVMYLSVTPHVEPTHTFYDAHGVQLPPRYGVWRAAGGDQDTADAQPGSAARSTTELLARYAAAAAALAELARANAATAGAAVAPASAETVAVKAMVDSLWPGVRGLLEATSALESAWNALALTAAR
jgi:mannose-6-phosphate isomerase-like protein (cupin superfamily)